MKRIIALLLAVITVLSLTGCFKSEEVRLVEEQISAIGEITLESKELIEKAEEALKSLPQDDAEKVGNKEVLTAARADYEDLLITQAAQKVEEKIANIGTVTLKSGSLITEARKSYDKEKENVKERVSNYNILTSAEETYTSLRVKKVADAIELIGEVTLESKELIESIRKDYNDLSANEKIKVENRNVFVEAETQLKKMIEEENEKKVEKLKKSFNVEEDKINNAVFYLHKKFPKYIDTRSYLLPYIGTTASGTTKWLMIRYNYTADTWLFWERITIWVDGRNYYKHNIDYFDITHGNDSDTWEYYDGSTTDADIKMLEAIVESKETIVRFESDDGREDVTIKESDKKIISEVLELYECL